jgi:tetratricopeptide (TPR) repeat protein
MSLERGADVFITKPFTVDSFRTAFVRAIERRLNGESSPLFYDIQPGPRVNSIEKAQNIKAEIREQTQAAYNSIVSLYDALMESGHKALAYKALSRMVKDHAPAPDRLNALFRLAIETRQFEDVEKYYEVFLKSDEKTESMVRHACAAMIVAGKAMLARGEIPRAISLFKKAVLTSGRKFSYIREIILALLQSGEAQTADSFLISIPEHERNSRESLILNYQVQSKIAPLHVTLSRGRELLSQGIDDSSVYKTLIEACRAARHYSEAESFAMDAARLWPEFVQENANA